LRHVGNHCRTGLDVGRSRTKLVQLTGTGDDLVLETAHVQALTSPEEASSGLKTVWKRAGNRSGSIRCNLGATGVIMHQLSIVDMPREELRSAVFLEAEQFLPDMDNLALDCQVLGAEEGGGAELPKLVTLIVAVPKTTVDRRLELLAKSVKGIEALVPDGLALANALHGTGLSSQGPAMAAEISREGTNLVIVPREGCPQSPIVHYIPIGLKGLVPAGAGHKEPSSKRVRNAPARDRWLREVDQTLNFAAGRLGAAAERLLVVGEGADEAGLIDWMGHNLVVAVARWNPLENLKPGRRCPKAALLEQIGPHTAVALGLAMMKEGG
jgi:Tfp pilus assembly PilM family ATPase